MVRKRLALLGELRRRASRGKHNRSDATFYAKALREANDGSAIQELLAEKESKGDCV